MLQILLLDKGKEKSGRASIITLQNSLRFVSEISKQQHLYDTKYRQEKIFYPTYSCIGTRCMVDNVKAMG